MTVLHTCSNARRRGAARRARHAACQSANVCYILSLTDNFHSSQQREEEEWRKAEQQEREEANAKADAEAKVRSIADPMPSHPDCCPSCLQYLDKRRVRYSTASAMLDDDFCCRILQWCGPGRSCRLNASCITTAIDTASHVAAVVLNVNCAQAKREEEQKEREEAQAKADAEAQVRALPHFAEAQHQQCRTLKTLRIWLQLRAVRCLGP